MISASFKPTLPTLDNGWQWQISQEMPYLTCSLLQKWQHGFFTQYFYPQTPGELVKILHPDGEAYRLKQVHGNQVLTPTEIKKILTQESDREFAPGDGIITEKSNQCAWVATADCTPVLIADQGNGTVAAVHAGWRGTAQKIVPEAIGRFLAMGSTVENLLIAMGPAISGKVYQVSEEVAAEVGITVLPNAQSNNCSEIIQQLQSLPNSPILPDEEPGKVKLDVRRVNALQIEQLGIKSAQVAIAPLCTYQQPKHLFSYRRSNEKKVQWSGIVSF